MKFAVPEITKIGVEVPSNRSALVGIITLSGGKRAAVSLSLVLRS